MNKRLVLLEVIVSASSLALGIWLHIKTDNWGLAVSIALAAEVLFHLFGFIVRYGPVLDAIRDTFPADVEPHGLRKIDSVVDAVENFRSHTIPLGLLANPPEEWYLHDRFNQIVQQLQQDLSDLDKQHFTVPMNDILEPSFRVCKEIRESAFCTALEKNLGIFLDTVKGKELLEANYKAAADLKLKKKFTRLFILDSLASVTPATYDLMQQNSVHDIRVLVLLRSRLQEAFRQRNLRQLADNELDFGLWDDKYRMTIGSDGVSRWMSVSAAPDDLKEARDVKAALEDAAHTWEEFDAELRKPLNPPSGGGWSTRPEKILHLPPPNGPYPQDVDAMFTVVHSHLPRNGSLAVMGLTHALIEKARLLRTQSDCQLEVVDCREYRPPTVEKGLLFRKANWLEWVASNSCDAIVGDDVICNLGIWQIPLFFESMARALKPGGIFVVRTTAIYSPDTMHPGREETVKKLKAVRDQLEQVPEGMTDIEWQSAIYEIAWPMMHSREYYDAKVQMFDLGAWDEMVREEFREDAQFGNHLRLPYHVKVTSVDYALLKEWSAKKFEIRQEEMPVHSSWANHPSFQKIAGAKEIASAFQEYYRILVFTKLA